MKRHIRLPRAFTLVEIMIVVAIIAILVSIAVPSWLRARENSRAKSCQENLTKIDGAKEQWAIEKKQAPGATPVDSDLFGDTLYVRKSPSCPTDGTYSINSLGTKPDCTLSSMSDFPHTFPF